VSGLPEITAIEKEAILSTNPGRLLGI
jgi:hypothetical protein